MHPSDCRCVKCLVDRSSFGTPDAIAARASVSDERVARVLARAKEIEAERHDRGCAAGVAPMARCRCSKSVDESETR